MDGSAQGIVPANVSHGETLDTFVSTSRYANCELEIRALASQPPRGGWDARGLMHPAGAGRSGDTGGLPEKSVPVRRKGPLFPHQRKALT